MELKDRLKKYSQEIDELHRKLIEECKITTYERNTLKNEIINLEKLEKELHNFYSSIIRIRNNSDYKIQEINRFINSIHEDIDYKNSDVRMKLKDGEDVKIKAYQRRIYEISEGFENHEKDIEKSIQFCNHLLSDNRTFFKELRSELRRYKVHA